MHPNQWPVLKLVQISIAVFKNGKDNRKLQGVPLLLLPATWNKKKIS